MENLFEIDGHHIKFNCCGKVLAVQYNESDDIGNPKACPFCGTQSDEVSTVRHGHWIEKTRWAGTFGQISTECSECGTVYIGRPGSRGDGKGGKFCEECGAVMDGVREYE